MRATQSCLFRKGGEERRSKAWVRSELGIELDGGSGRQQVGTCGGGSGS